MAVEDKAMNAPGTEATSTVNPDPSNTVEGKQKRRVSRRRSSVSSKPLTDSSTPLLSCTLPMQLTAKVGRSLVQRYGPPPRSNRLEMATQDERKAYNNIHKACSNVEMTWRLLYVTDFDIEKAMKILENENLDLWKVQTSVLLESFAKTESIFPLPSIETKTATEIFYIYPARFDTSCHVINMLNYLCLCVWQRNVKAKIGLLFDMQNYVFSAEQMSAVSIDQWVALVEWIQQPGIVNVETVLMVNCGNEFLKVWKNRLSTHLRKEFKHRFDLIAEDARNLQNYLNEEAEPLLPTDLPNGQASVRDLVQDFVSYRKALEELIQKSRPKDKQNTTTQDGFSADETTREIHLPEYESAEKEKSKKKSSRKKSSKNKKRETSNVEAVEQTVLSSGAFEDKTQPDEVSSRASEDEKRMLAEDTATDISMGSVANVSKQKTKKKSKKKAEDTKEDSLFAVSTHSVAMAPKRRNKKKSGNEDKEDTLIAVSTHSVAKAPKRKDKKPKSLKQKKIGRDSEPSLLGEARVSEHSRDVRLCDNLPPVELEVSSPENDSSTSSFCDDELDSADEFADESVQSGFKMADEA